MKYLHYFATTYYSATGHLYNASREFKQEQKLRRLNQASPTARASSSSSDTHDGRHSSSPFDETGGENPCDNQQETNEKGKRSIKGRTKERRPVQQDMYKIFDGSALMAIGMLKDLGRGERAN